jgi:hypothetical protein
MRKVIRIKELPMETVNLTPAERKAISVHSKRHGFVAVIEWAPRPRGGKFRPVRADAKPTKLEANRAAELMIPRYNAIANRVTVYRVNSNGRVLDSEVTFG